jgi:hypothetical protein
MNELLRAMEFVTSGLEADVKRLHHDDWDRMGSVNYAIIHTKHIAMQTPGLNSYHERLQALYDQVGRLQNQYINEIGKPKEEVN